jgi:hypothetical protein
MGRLLLAAIAVLLLTVGTLATRARLPNEGAKSNTWHTAKITRMLECGSDEVRSPQVKKTPSYPPKVTIRLTEYVPAETVSFPNLTTAFPQHVLRAPPQS